MNYGNCVTSLPLCWSAVRRLTRTQLTKMTVVVVMLTMASNAGAVAVSADDQGEALIIPAFTTLNGFDTLLSVTNTSERTPKAVKIRFRDREGTELQVINVYLAAGDAWTGALQAGGAGTIIELPDESCAFIDRGSGLEQPQSLSFGPQVGYVEIFEMAGTIDHKSLIQDHDCQGLVALWTTGDWSGNSNSGMDEPSGTLRGSASVINVEKGTMYSIVATALEAFSDIPQHEPPASPLPNLTTAHDAGTDSGTTTSQVCSHGTCYENQWSRPIDAVSAALSAHEVTGEFVIEESINASSEWILNFPTMHHYEETETLSFAHVSLLVVDRQGERELDGTCDGPQFPTPPPSADFECQTTFETEYTRSLEIIAFNDSASDAGAIVPSGILGVPHEAFFPLPDRGLPPNGYLRAGFTGQWGESIDGSGYWGRPVIAVALQEYVNGVLVGEGGAQQRANYSNAFVTSRKAIVVQP